MRSSKVSSFKDLDCWKLSKQVVVEVYATFALNKDYEFKHQIESAALSIMSNIAEGYGRYNRNEFRHFLQISMGSISEVRSLLEVAKDLRYCSTIKADIIDEKIVVVSKQVTQLIKYLLKPTTHKVSHIEP